MKKPRFSLKTLLFVVTLAAVLLGWWADHVRLRKQNRALRATIEEQAIRAMLSEYYDAVQRVRKQRMSEESKKDANEAPNPATHY